MLTRPTASNRPTPVVQSAGSDSDSDGYVGARRNIPSKKEKHRQQLVAAGRLPPSQAEVRFSSRRTKQVTNYNEEEEDQFEEEIDDDAIPNYYSTTVEDAGPGIDKVVDYRLKEGLGMFSQSTVVIMSLTVSRT